MKKITIKVWIILLISIVSVTISILIVTKYGILGNNREVQKNGPDIVNGAEVKQPQDKTWDTTKIKCYSDGNENTIPVPMGFIPITLEEGQGTKTTGFVIRDISVDNQGNPTETYGNEFVWVPVENMNYTYSRRDLDKAKGNYKYYSEDMPTDELSSVQNYGGFYIGRFEAGIVDYESFTAESGMRIESDWTGYNGGHLVLRSGVKVWDYIGYDKAVSLAEKLYNKESIGAFSKICSSFAWDTAVQFQMTDREAYESAGFFEDRYSNNNTKYELITGKDPIHPKNIYDMAGNAEEFTSEFMQITNMPERRRAVRGGTYNYSGHEYATPVNAGYRDESPPWRACSDTTFRVCLFLGD